MASIQRKVAFYHLTQERTGDDRQKHTVSNALYGVRYSYAHKRTTIMKYRATYSLYGVGYSYTCKRTAIRKCGIVYISHRVRYRYTFEQRAAFECVISDYLSVRVYIHAFDVFGIHQ